MRARLLQDPMPPAVIHWPLTARRPRGVVPESRRPSPEGLLQANWSAEKSRTSLRIRVDTRICVVTGQLATSPQSSRRG